MRWNQPTSTSVKNVYKDKLAVCVCAGVCLCNRGAACLVKVGFFQRLNNPRIPLFTRHCLPSLKIPRG